MCDCFQVSGNFSHWSLAITRTMAIFKSPSFLYRHTIFETNWYESFSSNWTISEFFMISQMKLNYAERLILFLLSMLDIFYTNKFGIVL